MSLYTINQICPACGSRDFRVSPVTTELGKHVAFCEGCEGLFTRPRGADQAFAPMTTEEARKTGMGLRGKR